MTTTRITINGKAYPCGMTMGAMLRFKRETGKELSEMDATSLSELCVFLWCCVASACRREKVEFAYTLDDFADNLDPEALAEWSKSVAEPNATEADERDAKKKE